MRDIESELDAAGLRTILVGSGQPEHARAFALASGIPFGMFTDPERLAFRAARMRRGVAWGSFTASLRAGAAGFRQQRRQGDAGQNGGLLLFDAAGVERYRYVSPYSGALPDMEKVLEAVRSLGSDQGAHSTALQ